MAFFCPVRIRKNKKKHAQLDGNDLLSDTNVGRKQLPPLGRITGSASIETLVRVAMEKENGLSPNSKMIVLHDFTPCVDDELEVKCGQIINVLYQENDWLYVIAENTGNSDDNQQPQEGFIPTSYCAPFESNLVDICNYKKKIPRNLPLNVNNNNNNNNEINNKNESNINNNTNNNINNNNNLLNNNGSKLNGLLDENNIGNNNFNYNQQFNSIHAQQQTTAAIIHHQQNNQLTLFNNKNNYCNDNVSGIIGGQNNIKYPISSTMDTKQFNDAHTDQYQLVNKFNNENKFTNNYYNHNQLNQSNCNRILEANSFNGNNNNIGLNIFNNYYHSQNNSKFKTTRLIDLPLTGKALANDRTPCSLVSNHDSIDNANANDFQPNKIYEMVIDYLREQQKQENNHNNRANYPVSNIKWQSILNSTNGYLGQVQPFIRQESHGQYVMLYKFMANNENDIDVGRGEIVTVLNKDDPDWLWIRRSDWKEGFVPISYTCPLDILSSN